MALINSYYLYQRYEKRGNQPWIPCYPNIWSVDGDGTMPLVLKEEHDPSCYNPIYRWVQTQDTICIDTTSIDVRTTSGDPYCQGYDKYVDTTTEQSFDGGITWEFVSSASTLVEQDSEYCGYHPTPEVQYRWTESGTTCDNANKYKRYIKEVSYDGGYVWIVVTPPQYSAGTLVEADSYDCGYRTSTTSSSTYCNGNDLYVDVYYRVSRDYGTTWITASTTPTLVEVGGCATPEVQYRWTPSGWTCVGYDKYQNNIKEQSTDGGETWTVVIPEEYSASTLIESQSTDCGYVPPTTDGKFRLTLSDSSTVTAACDSTSAITHDEISAYTASTVAAEIGECVTTIAGSAFYNCRSLTSVTIPNSVTSIGDFVFGYCTSLTSVTISDSITTISMAAFQSCSSLTSITIPNSVTSIGAYAFNQCTGLASVDIPSGVTSIDSQAFNDCSSITSITVDSNNATYDSRNNCNAIVKTNTNTLVQGCNSTLIPNSITSIGDSAFAYCRSLTSMAIPSSVTSIGASSFRGCSSLTSITIPNSVTTIGNYALSSCSSLTSVDIPSGVTTIGIQAFRYCSSLTSITIPNSVTTIGNYALSSCSSLTSVDIPSGVTTIGIQAFRYCSSLTSITVNATTPPTLGTDAFAGSTCQIYVPCASVETYKAASGWSTYASRIEGIPPCGQTDGKFKLTLSDSSIVSAQCDSTSAITHDEISAYTASTVAAEIGECVTTIAGSAFYNCRSLTSVTIPNSVTSINNQTFYGCSGLTSIDIPSGVTTIAGSAFYNCSSLSSVTIPNGVTSISDYAFYNCSSLTSVDIPNSVTSIGNSAFDGCSGLSSVTIPNGVTSISDYTFSYCSSLTNVAIPSSVTSIGNSAFNECSSLTSIDIPSGVTSISRSTFYGCSSLTSVSIPSGVTSISDYAFSYCSSLTSVDIPSGVTSIGNSAFNNCSSLTSITVNATTPPTLSSAFNNTNNCPIYVPSASVNTYKTTSGWSTYASRIQPIT